MPSDVQREGEDLKGYSPFLHFSGIDEGGIDQYERAVRCQLFPVFLRGLVRMISDSYRNKREQHCRGVLLSEIGGVSTTKAPAVTLAPILFRGTIP
jgi:hypothetical protein